MIQAELRCLPVERAEKEISGLKRARLARNWTLEMTLAAIGAHLPEGSATSVTASLLSSWERGKIQTSLRYRKILCDVFEAPADVLFEHQDGSLSTESASAQRSAPQILRPQGPELMPAMHEIVEHAEEYLVVTGSRSRSIAYLEAIEHALRDRPSLVHYRILYGMPHYRALPDHLFRLVELRESSARRDGKTLNIGLVQNTVMMVERFMCVSEKGAVIVTPSCKSSENFDSGIRLGMTEARELLQHGREAYAGSLPIETAEAIRSLDVLF